jgi:hypothetical protein
MKKGQKVAIGLNITNIIVLVVLVLAVLFGIFAISVLFAIFGKEVFTAVMKQLLIYSSFLEIPNIFIIVFTIISLAGCLCRKSPKKVEVFMVFHIICLVLSALCMLAPLCIALFSMIKASMEGSFSGNDWEGFGIVILYVVLEGFSLITNIFTIKYLNEVQKELDYGRE